MSKTVARFGKWLKEEPGMWGYRYATCGMCKTRISLDGDHDKFCPECGAKMIKEHKDDRV